MRAERVAGEQQRPGLLGTRGRRGPSRGCRRRRARPSTAGPCSAANAATSRASAPGWTPAAGSVGLRLPSGPGCPSAHDCASAAHADCVARRSTPRPAGRGRRRRRRAGRASGGRLSAKAAGSWSTMHDRLVVVPQRRAAEQQVAVEPAAHDEHDVGEGDGDAAVEERAEAGRVRVGQQARRVAGRRDREAGRLDEAPQRRPGARPERAAAGHDHGPLGAGQQRDRLVDRGGVGPRRRVGTGRRRGGRAAAPTASSGGASSTSVGSST